MKTDGRNALTQYLSRVDHKTATTLAHSTVRSAATAPGATPLTEDAFALNLYHRFDTTSAAELRGSYISSSDAGTDRGNVVGLQLYRFPTRRWVLGLGVDLSNYRIAHASQLTVSGGHAFSDELRLDLKGVFIRQQLGPDRATSRDSRAVRANLTYTPSRKLLVNLSRWWGETRFLYFSDGMYALDTLAVYRDGWSAVTTYRVCPQLKVFGKYGRFPYRQETPIPPPFPGGPPGIRETSHEATLTCVGLNLYF